MPMERPSCLEIRVEANFQTEVCIDTGIRLADHMGQGNLPAWDGKLYNTGIATAVLFENIVQHLLAGHAPAVCLFHISAW